jgi:hypothetical protein
VHGVCGAFGVLAAVASWRFWRAHWKVGVAVGAVCAPVLAFYCRFLSWSGDYCWGPRYLVYLIAPVMLSVPWWFDGIAARRRLRRGVFISFLVLGGGVQLLGSTFYWGHSVRIAMAARREWLGKPNRAGAMIAERGRGICDSCFEDMHGHIWLPPFNPLLEHWWLLEHVPFGDSWETAREDAPWRRQTHLPLDAVRANYESVRTDYWLWNFKLRQRPVAVGFIVWAAALLAGGILLCGHALRRRGAPAKAAEEPAEKVAS